MAGDKVSDPGGVGLGVLAQRPADGLIDEELPRTKVEGDDFFEQDGVCFGLAGALVVDSYAAHSQVGVLCPGRNEVVVGVAPEDFTNHGVEAVNGVPPAFLFNELA